MSARSSWSGRPSSPTTEPPKRWARLERPVGVAVGDEDRVGAPVGERARGQLAGLAGAEDDDVAFLKRAEHAQREVDRHRRNAHPARADPGLRAHALAGASARRRTGGWTMVQCIPPASRTRGLA